MEDFVTFEIAKKLKDKGFKEKCIGYYDYSEEFHYNYESAISNKEIYFCHNKYDNIWHRDLIDAPIISQVLDWLRKAWKVVVTPEYLFTEYDDWVFNIRIIGRYGEYESDEMYSSYEEASIAGIEYALDNLP